MISVIIPVHNSSDSLARCLQALVASDYPSYECIVVDDGSTDGSRAVAARFPVRLLHLPEGPNGPAHARNRGAQAAGGEILLFIDADVVLPPDALARVAETFAGDPKVHAMFGSYDETPGVPDFLSRYKNLSHHFIHQQANEDAVTFWSGCGAVRRDVFFEVGGFDERRYPRPSIEDIELGYRLRAAGHMIRLNKAIQVTHLKRWTLRGMIRSDIFDRGIPWTHLILHERWVPNDLNLRVSHRVSALLLYLLLLYLGLTAFFHRIVLLPLLAALFALVAGSWSVGAPYLQMSRRGKAVTYGLIAATSGLVLYFHVPRLLPPLALLLAVMLADPWLPPSRPLWNRIFFAGIILGLAAASALLVFSFSLRLAAPLVLVISLIAALNYRFCAFCARRQGVVFALAVVPFLLLYYLYSVFAFALGVATYLGRRDLGRRAPGAPAFAGGRGLAGSGRAATVLQRVTSREPREPQPTRDQGRRS